MLDFKGREHARCTCCCKMLGKGSFRPAMWSKRTFICHTCILDMERDEAVKSLLEESKKPRTCLKCDRTFNTTKQFRICPTCKQTKSYQWRQYAV